VTLGESLSIVSLLLSIAVNVAIYRHLKSVVTSRCAAIERRIQLMLR
jgi:hypothetical protein